MGHLLNQFSPLEKTNYQHKLASLCHKIDQYLKDHPKTMSEGNILRNDIHSLNFFFSEGKKKWFAQYMAIIDNHFKVKGLNGVYGFILTDYHRFWTALTQSERAYVSRSNDSEYTLPNLKIKEPARILNALMNDFGLVLKRFGYSHSIRLIDNSLEISLPKISDQTLFNVSATADGMKILKCYSIKDSELESIENTLFMLACESLDLPLYMSAS